MVKQFAFIIFICIAFISLATFLTVKIVKENKKSEKSFSKEIATNNEKATDERAGAKTVPLSEDLYFGVFENDKYKIINLLTQEEEKFIPDGFQIVDMRSYGNNPKFLILRKSNELYVFSVSDRKIKKIPNGEVEENEKVSVYQSITEDDHYYFSIKLITGTSDFGFYEVGARRNYLFNFDDNRLVATPIIQLLNGPVRSQEYDSKFKRFFSWVSGEGAPHFVPLSTYRLSDNTIDEFISAEEKNEFTNLTMNDGLFFVGVKNKGIMLIKPEKELKKELFLYSKEVKEKMVDYHGFSSVLYIERKNTMVVGASNYVSLFKIDGNEIVDYKLISDPAAYSRLIFTDYERVYYKPTYKNQIKILNLNTWEIEKIIDFENDGNPHAINIFRISR